MSKTSKSSEDREIHFIFGVAFASHQRKKRKVRVGRDTVASKAITDIFSGEIKFDYRRRLALLEELNEFHYRDRSVENRSLQIHILPWISIHVQYRYRFQAEDKLVL